MKVKELISALSGFNSEAEVIVSSDAEGNDYSKLSAIESMAYVESDGFIELGYPRLTNELRDEGYSEEDVIKGGKPAIILCP